MTLPFESWVAPRAGLTSTLNRLTQAPHSIAYLGLSVTAQREGFRPRLHDRLVVLTAQPHVAVNAGVGAVASVSLAFLMDALVLARRPALCFLEATTGDAAGGAMPALDEVPRAVEGIIRKLLAAHCAVCVIHSYRRELDWQRTSPVVAEYERVAEHYGVPSLNVARRLEDDFSRGTRHVDDLFRDLVHTTPAGAEATADLIVGALMWSRTKDAGAARTWSGKDTPRCTDGRYDGAWIQAVEPRHCTGAATFGSFRFFHPFVEIANGSTLTFCDDAAALKGLWVILGSSAEWLRVSTVDAEREYPLAGSAYARLSTVVFDEDVAAGVRVSVSLGASAAPARLRVLGFLCLSPRGRSR